MENWLPRARLKSIGKNYPTDSHRPPKKTPPNQRALRATTSPRQVVGLDSPAKTHSSLCRCLACLQPQRFLQDTGLGFISLSCDKPSNRTLAGHPWRATLVFASLTTTLRTSCVRRRTASIPPTCLSTFPRKRSRSSRNGARSRHLSVR